jgi:integrase
MVLQMPRPRLNPKTKIYEYRRRVPDDLRDRVGKREEKKSLGTRDPDTARLLHALHHAKVEERWRLLREGERTLSYEQCEALAGEIYAQYCEEHREPLPQGLLTHSFWEALNLDYVDGEIPDWRKPDDPPRSVMLERKHGARIDRLLADRGLIVDATSRARLLDATQRAARQAVHVALKRQTEGDYKPDPQADRFPEFSDKPEPKTLPLMLLYFRWVEAKKPAEETIPAWRNNIEKFIAHAGTDDALRITQAQVLGWRDSLRGQGIGGVRLRDGYIASLKAVLSWEVTEGHLRTNVAKDVKVTIPKVQRSREKDLRDDEVYLILKAALGPHEGPQSDDTKSARRWVPWLCAYSGARISEITGLCKEHVIKEQGIDGISIVKSKTGLSRKVPLHSHLIEQGFLKFVKSHEPGPLFVTSSRTRQGILRGHKTRAEGLAEWIREIGVDDEHVSPNHGWRHRFRTEALRINMQHRIIDYIQGHAPRTEGEKYGHIPLDVTAPWIQMLRYDVSGDSLKVNRKIPKELLQRVTVI